MIFKLSVLFLSLAMQVCALEPISIQVANREDYEVLEQFLRMGIYEEEYGYVLEGVKPISIRNFYSLDHFPVAKDLKYAEKEFANGLLVREVIPIWNRLCSHQKNFVLKAVPLKDPGSVAPGWEVQFINLSKVREVIDKNIDLFRYILDPSLETEQLVQKIAFSELPLNEIIKNDLVLVGIILGFGSYNSLVGGRAETIDALTISRDCAPFSSKSSLLQKGEKSSQNNFMQQCYGVYYLEFAGGDDSHFRSNFSPLQPSSLFSKVEDELVALDALNDPLPPGLHNEPAFIFGAYKGGPSNQPFFSHLLRVQKQIQALLKKPDFLEQVLEKIGGKKPTISCDKPTFSSTSFSLFRSYIHTRTWIPILQEVARRFESKEEQLAFFEAFCHPSTSSRTAPKRAGASKAILEGLKKSLQNLAAANTHFETLSKDSSLHLIATKQLYFKTTTPGSEKELKGIDRVRVDYVIENLQGDTLFANCDTWLSLSQTIPGFAHGVQGMHVGEKRTLFIHPALAYGVMTTLPPCIALIIKVRLIDIDETSSGKLPSLTPVDLSWVQNREFYDAIEESIQQLPRFIGSFYRDMLDKIEGLEKTALIAELDGSQNK
jgi:peptidylprolyl isomerase